MLTGEIRSQIDQVWNAFWTGGISNPLEVIEQITYLLFLKRLDEQETAEELKANRAKQPMEKRFFPEGNDPKGRPYADYRWGRFKNTDPREMYTLISDHVFPWLRSLGGKGSNYSKHMENAIFRVPSPALLDKVVNMIDRVPMEDRDTKGDLYEYMLGKIASAGQNGQFRTPRHIIRLMVEMVEPKPGDIVCDPACGTCGFLVAVGESLRQRHPEMLLDNKLSRHFHNNLFHGFDFDHTMLRIGSMNMLLHGVENPDITYRDSLAQDHAGEEEKYTLVLANPPFAGSLSALEEKTAIPMVRAELELILEIQTDEFWQDITTSVLENTRKRLRSLVKFIDTPTRRTQFADFTDELGEQTSVQLLPGAAGHDTERFREKTQHFLKAHENDPVIRKLRWNEPLTTADLDTLEKMLIEGGAGTSADISKARAGSGLGLFVRSLVGLDREAAKKAFAGFLEGKTLTANQIHFVDLMINDLTRGGWMKPTRLYESPFTDFSPKGIEGVFNLEQVMQLVGIVDDVRAKAAV